jgi:hypothetical protein
MSTPSDISNWLFGTVRRNYYFPKVTSHKATHHVHHVQMRWVSQVVDNCIQTMIWVPNFGVIRIMQIFKSDEEFTILLVYHTAHYWKISGNKCILCNLKSQWNSQPCKRGLKHFWRQMKAEIHIATIRYQERMLHADPGSLCLFRNIDAYLESEKDAHRVRWVRESNTRGQCNTIRRTCFLSIPIGLPVYLALSALGHDSLLSDRETRATPPSGMLSGCGCMEDKA